MLKIILIFVVVVGSALVLRAVFKVAIEEDKKRQKIIDNIRKRGKIIKIIRK